MATRRRLDPTGGVPFLKRRISSQYCVAVSGVSVLWDKGASFVASAAVELGGGTLDVGGGVLVVVVVVVVVVVASSLRRAL